MNDIDLISGAVELNCDNSNSQSELINDYQSYG